MAAGLHLTSLQRCIERKACVKGAPYIGRGKGGPDEKKRKKEKESRGKETIGQRR